MSFKWTDRVEQLVPVTGTGNVIFGGGFATPGYDPFRAQLSNGDTCAYFIYDPTSFAWEVGIGTYVGVGDQLARTSVTNSSNGGARVSFPGNVCQVAANISAYIMAFLYPTKDAMTYGTVQLGGVSSDLVATFTLDQDIATHILKATFTNDGSGSATAVVKVDGVTVTGMSSIAISAPGTATASGGNAVASTHTVTASFAVTGTLGPGAAFTLSGSIDRP